jgi:hypothetical protein
MYVISVKQGSILLVYVAVWDSSVRLVINMLYIINRVTSMLKGSILVGYSGRSQYTYSRANGFLRTALHDL